MLKPESDSQHPYKNLAVVGHTYKPSARKRQADPCLSGLAETGSYRFSEKPCFKNHLTSTSDLHMHLCRNTYISQSPHTQSFFYSIFNIPPEKKSPSTLQRTYPPQSRAHTGGVPEQKGSPTHTSLRAKHSVDYIVPSSSFRYKPLQYEWEERGSMAIWVSFP